MKLTRPQWSFAGEWEIPLGPVVYYFFDHNRAHCRYVGSTVDLVARLSAHAREGWLKGRPELVMWREFETIEEARRFERDEIRSLRPEQNIVGVPA